MSRAGERRRWRRHSDGRRHQVKEEINDSSQQVISLIANTKDVKGTVKGKE